MSVKCPCNKVWYSAMCIMLQIQYFPGISFSIYIYIYIYKVSQIYTGMTTDAKNVLGVMFTTID